MKITIEGDSQEIGRNKLTTHLRHFNEQKNIDININGLKYKGKISTIVYKNAGTSGKYRIIKINVVTI